MTTPTPHAFIAAQLDAEQAVAERALAAYDGLPAFGDTEFEATYELARSEGAPSDALAHIATQDPAATLRRVAADRRVLELHARWHMCTSYSGQDVFPYGGPNERPCETIRAFVSRYPDAPGFREEWT